MPAICLGLVIAVLSLGGCGGTAKRTTAASSGTTTAGLATSTTGSLTTESVTTITGTNTSGSPPPPQAHAEVPAIFDVLAGGSLRPRTVSVPAALPIELTVVSRDGRRHTAVLRNPSPHSLSVPAGGRASVLVSGLKPGTYALELDGADRAALVVGVAPGP